LNGVKIHRDHDTATSREGLIADPQIHGFESRRDWVLRHHLAEVDSPGAEQVGHEGAEPDNSALRIA